MHSSGKFWSKLRGITAEYQSSGGLFPGAASAGWRNVNLDLPVVNRLRCAFNVQCQLYTRHVHPSTRNYSLPAVHNDGASELDAHDPLQVKPSALFFDFRVLHSGEDIEKVIQRLGDSASMPLICAAATRMKQLPGPYSQSALELLATQTIKKGDEMTPRNISSWWHACAKMRYFHDGLFEKLGDMTGSPEFISSCLPMDLSNTLYGMGVLQKARELDNGVKVGNGPVADWFGQDLTLFSKQDTVLERLVENSFLSSHPKRLNEVQMCGSVYGLGLLRFQETHLLEQLTKEAVDPLRLIRYVDIELVNIVYGLAMMGIKAPHTIGPLLDELCSPRRLGNLREPEMSALIQALRILEHKDEKILGLVTEELEHSNKYSSFSEHGLSMITTNLRLLGVTKLGHLVEGLASTENMDIITPQGVSMALYNLCCAHERDAKVVQTLVDKALEPDTLEGYSEQDLANVMYALSIFRKQKPGLYDGLSEELMKPERLVKFREQHLANIFYGGGKLYLKRALPHCFAECLKAHRLPKFSAGNLYNIVYGLGQIDFKDHTSLDLLMSTLLQVENLKDLTSQQLSTILYSLGRMGYQNQVTIAKIMEEATLQARLEDFSTQGLSSIVYGLSQMDFRDGRMLGALLKEVILERRLQDFRPQELSIVVHGLGKIGVEDSRVLLPVLKEVTSTKRMMSFSSHNLTNILYGLAHLERFDMKVWDILFREITTPGILSTFKSLELSLIIYAVGMKGYTRPNVLETLIREATLPDRLEDFSIHGLASIIYSLSQIEYIHMDAIRLLVNEFVKVDRIASASPHHIANVVYAIGALKFKDKDSVRALKEEILAPHRLPKFSRHGLYNLFYGLALLKYRSQSLLDGLWGEVLKIERLLGFSEREWVTIAYCVGQLKFMDEDAVIKIREDTLFSRGLPNTLRRQRGGDFSPKEISIIQEEEHRKHMLEDMKVQRPSKYELEDEAPNAKYTHQDGVGLKADRTSGRGAGLGRGDMDKPLHHSHWRTTVTQEYYNRIAKDCHEPDHGGDYTGQQLGVITGSKEKMHSPLQVAREMGSHGYSGSKIHRTSTRDDRGTQNDQSLGPVYPQQDSNSGSRDARDDRNSWHDERNPNWRGNPLDRDRGRRRPDYLETSPVGAHRQTMNRSNNISVHDRYPTTVDHSINSRHAVHNHWQKTFDSTVANEDEARGGPFKEKVVQWRDESQLKRVPQLPGRADIGVGYADSLLNVTRSQQKKVSAKDKALLEDMANDMVDFVKGLDKK